MMQKKFVAVFFSSTAGTNAGQLLIPKQYKQSLNKLKKFVLEYTEKFYFVFEYLSD